MPKMKNNHKGMVRKMKKCIRANGEYELVLSKDECGYQPVLDEFEDANEINIVTYNISKNDKSLLDKLNELDEEVMVSVVTNVPSRFQRYFSDKNRNAAHNNIQYYLRAMQPEQYIPNFISFFNFTNHSKIIMTESIAYIGSANYSNESDRNFECGFITRDRNVIQQIKDAFIATI